MELSSADVPAETPRSDIAAAVGDCLPAGLITQRSQVQILSPLPVNDQVRGPFALRSGRAFDVHVRISYAPVVAGRGRMLVGTGGYRAEVGELDVVLVTVASVTLGASQRSCARSWRPQASPVFGLRRSAGERPATGTPSALVRLVLTPYAIT